MNRIIFTNEGVAEIAALEDGVDAEAEAEKLGLTNYEIVEESDIPSDRAFRKAWKHDTTASSNKIGVQEVRAQVISLKRVRAKRDAELLNLDPLLSAAMRKGEDTTELDAKRQKLLDATEELKALDVSQDGLISVEEAADKFLPLELIEI